MIARIIDTNVIENSKALFNIDKEKVIDFEKQLKVDYTKH